MKLARGKVFDTAGVVPEWIHVMPGRDFEANGKKFKVTAAALASIVELFNARENDAVLDYEHLSLEQVESAAAGWITALEVRPDGLWACVSWTKRAAEYITAREYRYISPVWRYDKATGLVKEFINAALTNNPAIDGMAPVVARKNMGADASPENPETQEAGHMKKVLEMLGLPPEATEEQAAARMKEHLCLIGSDVTTIEQAKAALAALSQAGALHAATLKQINEALGIEAGSSVDAAVGAIRGLSAGQEGIAAMRTQLDQLLTDRATATAEGLVTAAMEAGKITADQRDWAVEYARTSPEGFRAFVAKAPQIVPVGPSQRPKAPVGTTGTGHACAAASLLGLTDDQFNSVERDPETGVYKAKQKEGGK